MVISNQRWCGHEGEYLNELALFAGAGGGILGSKLLGWRTVCYVEWDNYCIEVLKARIRDCIFDDAPIWDDVRTFDGTPWSGCVDIVTAGFPCQPFSTAGKRKGKMDKRNQWPDTIRIIREVKPIFCLLENVPGLIRSGYFETILKELAESGYDARWKVISAAEMGAPHKRDRLWIVANSSITRSRRLPVRIGESQQTEIDVDGMGEEKSDRNDSNPIGIGCYTWSGKRLQPEKQETVRQNIDNICIESNISDSNQQHEHNGGYDPGSIFIQEPFRICDASSAGLSDREQKPVEASKEGIKKLQFERPDWWKTEPGMGRVVDGMDRRVDRLKAIGNGQVPAVVRAAWNWLINEL